MKTTLLGKWNALEERIAAMSNEFIDAYFEGKERPTVIYHMAGLRGIEEFEVTGFSIYKRGKPYFEKKPTAAKAEELEKWFADFHPDETMLYINYRGPSVVGSFFTSATTFGKITEDTTLSLAKDDLIPVLLEWQQKYAPREGHIPCTYCRKQVPQAEAVECTVIARQYPGMRKTSKYCSQLCGTHDQWAHEG